MKALADHAGATARAFLTGLALILAVGSAGVPAGAQSESEVASAPLEAAERAAIEQVIRDYLKDHPEVVGEALSALRAREEEAQAARQRAAVRSHARALADPGPLPVLGNPDGDVTVVEFFDYRCPYCQRMAGPLREVVAEDGNVRLVMKEFPILGEDSVFAARAAVAAAEQGAYAAFHDALMTELDTVTPESVLALAERLDLDRAKLEADMRAEVVRETIQGSYRLAQALGIGGTPAFVVGETLVPGAVDAQRLRDLIAQARTQARERQAGDG